MGESAHLSPIVASPPGSSPGRLGREVPFLEISCRLPIPGNRLMSREMAITKIRSQTSPSSSNRFLRLRLRAPRRDPRETVSGLPVVGIELPLTATSVSAHGPEARDTEEMLGNGPKESPNTLRPISYIMLTKKRVRIAARLEPAVKRKTGKSAFAATAPLLGGAFYRLSADLLALSLASS